MPIGDNYTQHIAPGFLERIKPDITIFVDARHQCAGFKVFARLNAKAQSIKDPGYFMRRIEQNQLKIHVPIRCKAMSMGIAGIGQESFFSSSAFITRSVCYEVDHPVKFFVHHEPHIF